MPTEPLLPLDAAHDTPLTSALDFAALDPNPADHQAENAATLARLVTILDYAEGFTLLFARCNFPVLRRELEAAAAAALTPRHVRVIPIHLTAPVTNIRHLLREQLLAATTTVPLLADETAADATALAPLPVLHEPAVAYATHTVPAEPKLVLFLTGLELSIPYDDPGASTLAQLNLGRDFFPRELPHPLLIWLPDYALTAIAQHAPDFWSWRSGLFEFEGTPTERAETLDRYTRSESNWLTVSNLRAADKVARRSLLESLLDDYEHLHSSEHHDNELAAIYFNLGQIYHVQDDFTRALHHYQRALMIRQAIGDRAGQGIILNNMAVIHVARREYEMALHLLEQALFIRQAIGDKAGEGTTLNNISQIYDAWKEYETALRYLGEALAILQEIGDKAGEGSTLNNISLIYAAHGEYETALRYLEQALAIQKEIGDKAGEAVSRYNIAMIYIEFGRWAEAITELERVVALDEAIGHPDLASDRAKLAEVRAQLAENNRTSGG